MKLGAQFYTLRNRAATPDGLRECFKVIHDIGYDNAQMSAICKVEPEYLRGLSEEFSLPIVCTHSSFDRITGDTDALLREHKIYGCPVIGIGGMPGELRGSVEGAREFLRRISEPMKKINDAGLKFAYHNHAFEFANEGKPVYDILIEEAPELNFILDTYWIKYAGHDMLDYIRKIGAARMQNVHFKDMRSEPKGDICPCGDGVIDFRPVIALCDELGIPNALVEQDNAPDLGDEFLQMKSSHDFLRPLL